MKRRITAALLCAATLQAVATDYHMCYSPSTQAIVFKGAPCAPGMTAQPSPDYPRSGFNPETVARCEAEAVARGELAGGAAATTREKKDKFDAVQVGMTALCAKQLLGEPSSVNSYNHGSGGTEQWVYKTGKFLRDHYVYIRNGHVSSLSLSR